MSYKYTRKRTYNADEEDPNCGRCDHACDRYELFCAKCGPEYWWHNYIRTEIREIEISDEEVARLKKLLFE